MGEKGWKRRERMKREKERETRRLFPVISSAFFSQDSQTCLGKKLFRVYGTLKERRERKKRKRERKKREGYQ